MVKYLKQFLNHQIRQKCKLVKNDMHKQVKCLLLNECVWDQSDIFQDFLSVTHGLHAIFDA